ncbi:carbohydrate kinase family protein [Orenia marismortui]|uniref:Ribokinase n=1 Tax=Orenia marismortui TaxID=46469 RepID=A0A4R8H088_9FIRM|nr:carbohydrate kinase family protein [Orenia marismortui]TDX48371.1 ribokinase [Orenia marismortui]
MSKILVSGLINIETTLKIKEFPLEYNPVNYPFFGVNSTVSGVGYNLAKALTTLGDEVNLLSMIGRDLSAKAIISTLEEEGIAGDYVLDSLKSTPQSIIIYDEQGKRQIHVDLKNIQESNYPEQIFEKLAKESSILALCNINFSRSFLKKAVKLDKIVATDVHTISDLNDDYNKDFMEAADILFMSDELLPTSPEGWVNQIFNKFKAEIVVIGLGSQGALLAVRKDNFVERIPAVKTREIVNTIGAGDALFSAFIHFYNQSRDPYESLKKAIVFASYKIGATSAAEGFLAETELTQLYNKTKG